MGDWNGGAVFGVVWICILTPLHILFAFLFWRRGEVQPIKARFPALVLGCDFILILFEIALCIQRIVGDSYPCLLNLWSGFIGLLVLFNTYMWRCWMLYFTFGLTQERFEGKKKSESFFLRHRYLVNPKFLTQVMGTLTVILTLPCGIITAQNRALPELQGDNCDRGTGDIVLASYGAVYVFVFLIFSFKLRQVVDGFKIKEEMKFTGLIAIVVFIPWVTFNNFAKSANADFPFSTLFLLLGVAFAFGLSTTWPLARSYFAPVNLEEALGGGGGDFSTLDGLLLDKGGLGSFKKFLTKEFSVENILFFEEVEEYRQKKKARLDALQLVAEAQRIYAKYILNESPFQVNLPDLIVKDLEGRLKDVFEKPEIQLGPEKPLVENPARVPPTLFDRAQENIYKLMNSDSFPRYVRSDEYKKLCTEAEENKKRLIILVDEGIAEKKSISSSRKESSRLGTIEKGGGGGGDEQYQPDDGEKSPDGATATTSTNTSPMTAASSVSPGEE